MARKSIKLNYIYNTMYQVLTLLAPLVTAPYLSRVLGPSGIGLYSYTASIVSYFTLFAALGQGTFGQREIAYAQDDRARRTKIFWEIKIISFLAAFLVLALYMVFAWKQENAALYFVMAIEILSVAADITWLYAGMEEFGVIVLRNTIVRVLFIVFIFVFVKTEQDLLIYAAGGSGMILLSHIVAWFGIGSFVGKPNLKDLKPFANLSAIISLFVPTIAIQVYTVLDKTMIGLITQNAAENGYYEQSIKLSKMVLMLVTSLGTVMIPRIGYYYAKNDTEQVQAYMYRGYRFVWFLGIPLCFGLIGVAESFVPWFYGDGYEKCVPLLCTLSILIVAIGISSVTGMQYLIPTKRQRMFTVTVVVGAVVNFVLNLILIPSFASVGAAIASVLAEISVSVVQIYLVRKELSPWEIVKSSKNYLIAGAFMLAAVLGAGSLTDATILGTMILVVVGIIVYFGVLLILRDDFFADNLKNILGKVLKNDQRN